MMDRSTGDKALSRALSLSQSAQAALPPSLSLAQTGGSRASVPFSIDPSTGNLTFRARTPLGGPFAPAGMLLYNSQAANVDLVLGDASLGNKWFTNLRAAIKTHDPGYAVEIAKGTGELVLYTATSPVGVGGYYNPQAGTANSLQATSSGFAEKQTGGFEFDYTNTVFSLDWPTFTLAQWASFTLAQWGTGFGTIGQMSALKNPSGSTWSLTYSSGTLQIQSILDPVGGLTTYSYVSGLLSQIQDSVGRVTAFTMDGSGNLTGIMTPELCQTNFAYDGSSRMTAWVRPDSTRVSFAYDTSNRVTNVTWPSGGTATYGYGGANRTTQFVDPQGNISTLIYDEYGNLGKFVEPNSQTHTLTWANGMLYTYNSPLAWTPSTPTTIPYFDATILYFNYTTLYDGTRRLASVKQPYGGIVTYNYGSSTLPQSVVDELSHTTTIVWDANSNRKSVTDALGATTTYSYTTAGQLQSTTNPLGFTTTHIFDSVAGNLLATVSPLTCRLTRSGPFSRTGSTIWPTNSRTKTAFTPTHSV